MNTATMRTALADAYPRRTWRHKVMNMSEAQVVAIYKNMERTGQLFDHIRKRTPQDDEDVRIAARMRAEILE